MKLVVILVLVGLFILSYLTEQGITGLASFGIMPIAESNDSSAELSIPEIIEEPILEKIVEEPEPIIKDPALKVPVPIEETPPTEPVEAPESGEPTPLDPELIESPAHLKEAEPIEEAVPEEKRFGVKFSGTGTGTLADPYQITNVTQLQEMNDDKGANYTLMNNIDASATSGWNGGAGFVPIGSNINKFLGSLDGNDKTISGLYVNRPATDYQALIGWIEPPGSIHDVHLTGVNITGDWYTGALLGWGAGSTITNCSASGVVQGWLYTGGLIGDTEGPIFDCSANVNVTGTAGGSFTGGLIGETWHTSVTRSFATGTVTHLTGTDEIGGLVGFTLNTDFYECYATGDVNAPEAWYVGGLIGYHASDDINKSYATGAVNGANQVGGLVGFNNDEISDCYATGAVNGSSSVGGLVGYNDFLIYNSYSIGAVNGSSDIGGLVGEIDAAWKVSYNSFWDNETSGLNSSSCNATGKTTAEMKDVATFTDLTTANLSTPWDFIDNPNDDVANRDIWTISNSYPYFGSLGSPFPEDASTPPVLNSSSGTNTSNENITCYNATGGANTNIYNWYKNDQPIMVLNMPFDTNYSINGSAGIKDYSGYGNNGTPYNFSWGNTGNWTPNGKIGGAYEFDGVDDLIEIADDPSLDFTNSFTLTAWVYENNEHQGTGYVIRKMHGATSYLYRLSVNNGSAGVGIYNGAVEKSAGQSGGAAKQWYHVAGTYNTTHLVAYINGTAGTPTATNIALPNTAHSVRIGMKYAGNSLFNGTIDDVRVYSTSLSAAQIYQLYQDTKDGYSNNQTIVSDETSVGENWTCSLTPNNGIVDGSAENSSTITILGAVTHSARISPATPNTTSKLLGYCNGTTITTANYYYRWYKAGVLNLSGYNGGAHALDLEVNVHNLSAGNTTGDETWVFSCLASTGIENATNWKNATVTLASSATTISANISPASPNTTSELLGYCNGTTMTPSNYYYIWYKNGSLNLSGYNAGAYSSEVEVNVHNLSAGNTSSDETWTFSCLASTGIENATNWKNATVTLATSAITVSANISPTSPDTSSELIGYCNGTTITTANYYYRWYKEGSLDSNGYNGRGFASNVEVNVHNLSSGNTSNGQNWTFSCLASIGAENATNWKNATATIGNFVPTHSNPLLRSPSGTNLYSIENITCYNQSTLDVDGDSVTNIYNWYRNDTPIMVLNMPFETNISNATVTDSLADYSTHANHGTGGGGSISRTPTWTSSGKVGGAYVFDGADDYISIDDTASLNVSTALTLAAWVKSTDNGYVIVKDPPLASETITAIQDIDTPIIQASVQPTKVVPGDTMQIIAEVKDEHGIISVIANMPYEGGSDIIELELKEGDSYHGTWEGEWLVHDTIIKDYLATIKATSSSGKSSTAVVSFSDPLGVGVMGTRSHTHVTLSGGPDPDGAYGMTLDNNRDIWGYDWNSGPLNKYNGTTGVWIKSVALADDVTYGYCLGLAVDLDGRMYCSGYSKDRITVFWPETGVGIASHATVDTAHGVYFDGKYIWYGENNDGAGNRYYRVDVTAGGWNVIDGPFISSYVSNAYDMAVVGDVLFEASTTSDQWYYSTNLNYATDTVNNAVQTANQGTGGKIAFGQFNGTYMFRTGNGDLDIEAYETGSRDCTDATDCILLLGGCVSDGTVFDWDRDGTDETCNSGTWSAAGGKSDVPYSLSTLNGGEFLVVDNGTHYNATASGNINDDAWHHLAATYDGANMKIYVDGSLKSTNTNYSGILPSNNDEVWIGRNYSGSNGNFTGTIDEVKIYNISLSATQIYQLYFDTKDGYSSSQTIVSDETVVGENWTCSVTPNDGIEDGTLKNSSTKVILAGSPDTIFPAVTINDPSAGDVSGTILINVAVTDADSGVNSLAVYYWLENSTGNQTAWTLMSNTTVSLFNATFDTTTIAGGNYNVTINASDIAGNENSSEKVQIRIGATEPAILLISPANGYKINDGSLSFSYQVSAVLDITSCSLILSGSIDQTDTTIIKDTAQSFTKSGLGNGAYTWSINCTDAVGNINSSETRSFTVLLPDEEVITRRGGAPAPSLFAPPEVVIAEAVQTVGTLVEEELVTIEISNSEISVKQIEFMSIAPAEDVTLTVRALSQVALPEPPGILYQYLTIDAKNIEIKASKISYAVPVEWINENNIEINKIRLYRYEIDKWVAQKTEIASESDKYITFSSENRGFSYFAITGEVIAKTPARSFRFVEFKPELDRVSLVLLTVVTLTILVFVFLHKKKGRRAQSINYQSGINKKEYGK